MTHPALVFLAPRRAVCLLLVLLAQGCTKDDPLAQVGAKRAPMAFPVEVSAVEERAVEYAVDAVGSVEAFERVQVTSRIAGVVDRVAFAEGAAVARGQVLAEVETERFRLAREAARANLDRAKAALADARSGLERRENAEAASPGLVRAEELETFRTRARLAEVDAAAAKIAVQQAELNLRDAYLRAPVAGTIETRSVQTGQYVQPGDVVGSLLQREPLLLRFAVAELEAARLRPGMKTELRVRGALQPFTASITHVSDAADPKSRLVPVTARVDDPRRNELRTGSFAEVRVPVAAERAPVIPQTAVRPTERGFLAFVVEAGAAKERLVALGLRTPDGLVEIRSGVEPGEQVVVRGAEALREGVPVRVVDTGARPANVEAGGTP